MDVCFKYEVIYFGESFNSSIIVVSDSCVYA